jgi:ATP/maltotriose-dependent transcriptional regulator MalT
MSGRAAARATAAMAKALEESGDYAQALDYATRTLPYTEGEAAHFGGANGAPMRLQHARLLQRLGRTPEDCAAVMAVLAIEKAKPAVHNEAIILAAACAAGHGRADEAKQRLSTLPAASDALDEVSPYVVDLLRGLRRQ